MREQERINRILSLVKRYWHLYPDMRLAQIIANLNAQHRANAKLPRDIDVFFLEDGDLEEQLRRSLSAKPSKSV